MYTAPHLAKRYWRVQNWRGASASWDPALNLQSRNPCMWWPQYLSYQVNLDQSRHSSKPMWERTFFAWNGTRPPYSSTIPYERVHDINSAARRSTITECIIGKVVIGIDANYSKLESKIHKTRTLIERNLAVYFDCTPFSKGL